MFIRWRTHLTLLLLAVLGLVPALLAQSDSSSISGTITDSAGAVVPRATVTIRNEATSESRTATSNDAGFYTVSSLPPGLYTIQIEAQGFQGFVQQHTHLDPSIGLRVDAALKVGSSSTTVNVVANANVVQTETAAVGQLVTRQQVQAIQLNGRNPIYLAQMEPGVRRGNSMSAFGFGLDNPFNINGSNYRENGQI
ncbi:MAG TPA: carboxypeptidase-like regulatory domain-containing protein [Pseudacidobacterium sp.]|nr:carboxypeptidase-like regulatory domain-containing protein [Pseudacidobacterium sp.]